MKNKVTIMTIIIIIIIFEIKDHLGSLYKRYFTLFFSCSLICAMMDERTERYDKFFPTFFIDFLDEVL